MHNQCYSDRNHQQNTQLNVTSQNQGQRHYCQDNRNTPVPVQAMCPDPDMHIQVSDDYLLPYLNYNNPDDLDQGDPELTLYTQFCKAVVQLADNAERRDRHCHNCKETGHFWQECQQPLREEFKHLMDCTCQHQEELSKNGGPRVKGSQVPQVEAAQPQSTASTEVPAVAQH